MKLPTITVKISTKYIDDGEYQLVFTDYAQGRTPALVIQDKGSPVAKASVCEPTFVPSAHNQILIKDWRENAGITEELFRLGIIKPYMRNGYQMMTSVGNEVAPVYLLQEAFIIKMAKEQESVS